MCGFGIHRNICMVLDPTLFMWGVVFHWVLLSPIVLCVVLTTGPQLD